MDKSIIVFAVIIVILLLILGYGSFSSNRNSRTEHITSREEPPKWPHYPLFFPLPTTMGELTELEQMEVLEDMFRDKGDDGKSAEEIKRENEYIKNLPRSSDCDDHYEGCPIWASRGECVINPEYMLYKCPSSCEACVLNDQEKYNVTYIYNTRDPPGCVYHGEDYPSTDRYIHSLYMMSQ